MSSLMPSFFLWGMSPLCNDNYYTTTKNHLLFKQLASKECRQDADGVLDQIGNHPGLEEPTGDILLAGLALVFALTDPFLVLSQLQVQLLKVVAGESEEGGRCECTFEITKKKVRGSRFRGSVNK